MKRLLIVGQRIPRSTGSYSSANRGYNSSNDYCYRATTTTILQLFRQQQQQNCCRFLSSAGLLPQNSDRVVVVVEGDECACIRRNNDTRAITTSQHRNNNIFLNTNKYSNNIYRKFQKCNFSSSSSSTSNHNLTGDNNTNNNNNLTTQSDSSSTGTLISKDGVIGLPIDFDIASKIEGNESQILTVTLQPGQVLRAESGAMMYMTDGITMNTTTGGGISSGFQRMLTGQNMFISDYTYEGDSQGVVALGTDFPSKIIRLNVNEYNGKLICQKGALLCANHTVDIQIEFTKNLTSGFFGGEGFILQGLTGEGDVFLKAGGTLIRRELKPGEQLRISSGCLVAFSNGVDYDVQMVKGFANVFAGGEGLFITTLTGPGVVWLQGQPPQRMISEIVRRVPSGGGLGFAIPIGGGGGGGGGESSDGSSGAGST